MFAIFIRSSFFGCVLDGTVLTTYNKTRCGERQAEIFLTIHTSTVGTKR